MNVLCVLNASVGGATQGILELLPWLPDDVRFTLVVPDDPGSRLPAGTEVVPMSWWNRRRELPWWYRPLVWGAQARRTGAHALPIARLRRLIRERSIDLVYTGTAMTVDGAVAARLAGVPHVWHFKEWVGNRGRTRFPLPDPLLMRVIDGLSDRIVAMSDFIAAPLREGGLNVDVVPDGVDPGLFDRGEPGSVREELGLRDGELLVAMCASFRATWKRHDVFIDAALRTLPSLPEATFVGFGSTPLRADGPYGAAGQAFARLSQRARPAGERIQLGRFCPDIPGMMRAIDVLVHTCDIEPFGRVAIEAMAASRPVVGPARGGIAETVVDGETGRLVPPGDASAFADAIVDLARDPARRDALGAAGRSRVESTYTMARHRDALLTIFEDCLR